MSHAYGTDERMRGLAALSGEAQIALERITNTITHHTYANA